MGSRYYRRDLIYRHDCFYSRRYAAERDLSRYDLKREDIQLLSSAPAFYVFAIGCLLSLPYSQILMIIPMLQFLLWLALGALIVIHRSVRLNSGTQYE